MIIAVVGMCGSGKSIVSDYLVKKGFQFLRFGQITLDEVKKKGIKPDEKTESKIREDIRKERGMAAFAILNKPKIDELSKKGDVVIDGLYSWSEYKYLKEIYKEKLVVIAVYASPKIRYSRISKRSAQKDPDLRHRSFSVEDAKARDCAEIENIEKGGPIAMADFTLVNEGSLEELYGQVDEILEIVTTNKE